MSRYIKQWTSVSDESSNDLVTGEFSFSVADAKRIVHLACKAKKYEYELENKKNNGSYVSYRAYALVDAKRFCVYALKVQMWHNASGLATQGYIPVRFYGDASGQPVAPAPAPETAKLEPPKVMPTPLTALFDDHDQGVDDFAEADIPVEAKTAATAGGVGGSVVIDLSEVTKRLDGLGAATQGNSEQLAKLADAMARTAAALEKIAALKAAKHEREAAASDKAQQWFRDHVGK